MHQGGLQMLEKIDATILSFFTKISHAFQRLTGRTNFFLAKCSIIMAGTSLIVHTVGYWIPITYRDPSLLSLFLIGPLLVVFGWDMRNCDRADDRHLSSERTKFPFPSSGHYWLRLLLLAFFVFDLITSPPVLFASRGILIFFSD